MLVCILVPHFIYYRYFEISFEVRTVRLPTLFFLKIDYSYSMSFYINFKMKFSITATIAVEILIVFLLTILITF